MGMPIQTWQREQTYIPCGFYSSSISESTMNQAVQFNLSFKRPNFICSFIYLILVSNNCVLVIDIWLFWLCMFAHCLKVWHLWLLTIFNSVSGYKMMNRMVMLIFQCRVMEAKKIDIGRGWLFFFILILLKLILRDSCSTCN